MRSRFIANLVAVLVGLSCSQSDKPVCIAGQSGMRQAALLDVSQGQVPNDTGSDGATVLTIVDSKDLGGKALKVVYASGDSFGDRVARIQDWRPFSSLQFDALNPGQGNVRLMLTVKHKQTTDLHTRVELPVVLKPGKNAINIRVDAMRNENGSMPDLSDVGKWYLACEPGATPTLFVGNIWLLAAEQPPATAPMPAGGPAVTTSPASPASPLGVVQSYHVTGKTGDMAVDLRVIPEMPLSAAIAKPPAVGSDPARLARLRAEKMPPIARPVTFDTSEADAILSALEVFPPDNPWNQVVADWPLHANSKNIVASIGVDRPLRYNPDMGFVLVPPGQKRIEVKITQYAGESDKGPFPVPDNVPIEGWPGLYRDDPKAKGLTLDDIQRDRLNRGGDRHGIVVDPVNRMLYEFFGMRKTDYGWEAAQASRFDLKTGQLRPAGWTSADAAGLPIFPAVVRYDELQRGIVEHAMRVTVHKTRKAYVAPATHFASRLADESLPRMGERLRLRQDYDISSFSPPVQAILKGLKKYGMFVADNGIAWAISVAPDPRIPALHEELRKIKGSAFEVVVPPQ